MKLIFIKFNKFSLLLILVLFLFSSVLKADLLVLQNGKRITGFFLKERKGKVFFRNLKGRNLIFSKSFVKKVSIGYNGSSFCLTEKRTLNKSSIKKCNSLLYKFQKEKILVAEGEGFLQIREIPLDKVEALELKNDKGRNNIAKIIPQAKEVSIVLAKQNKTIKGRVLSTNSKNTVIKDSQGKIHHLKTKKIASVIYHSDKKSKIRYSWWHIYPGLAQIERGDTWTGTLLASSFTMALGGIYAEYNSGLAVSKAAASDPTVILFYNQTYKEKFEKHQKNQKNIGALAVLIYAIHAVDYFYNGNKKNPPKNLEKKAVNFFIKTNMPSISAFNINTQQNTLAKASFKPYTIVKIGFQLSY